MLPRYGSHSNTHLSLWLVLFARNLFRCFTFVWSRPIGYLGIEEHCFNKHLCLWSKTLLKSNYVPTFVLPLIYWVETRLERQVQFLC